MSKRRIVIDADIVCSASEKRGSDPRPAVCTELLQVVRSSKYSVVISPEILAEYKRNRSAFSSTWITSMVARRQVTWLSDAPDSSVRTALTRLILTATELAAILKDIHLVEAAIATDRIVVSLDEAARALFRHVAVQHSTLAGVLWANPERDGDVAGWLQNGAREHDNRRLLARVRGRKP